MRWIRFQAHSNLRITTLRRVVSQWALPRWLPVQSAITDGATLGTLLERLPKGAAGKPSIAPWQRIGLPVNAARCHDSMRLRDQSLHFTRLGPGAETSAIVAPGRRQSALSSGSTPIPRRSRRPMSAFAFSVDRFSESSNSACSFSFGGNGSRLTSALTSTRSRHR